jgi:hypothetical protein
MYTPLVPSYVQNPRLWIYTLTRCATCFPGSLHTASHSTAHVPLPFAFSSTSSTSSFFFFKCGKVIVNTRRLTMAKSAMAEMKTIRRLWE